MNKINYTITGKTDGFGAQYQSIMSGIAYCKFKNYNYIHTPFKKISQSYNQEESLNKFIGIPIIDFKDNINISEKFSKTVHYSQNPSNYYTNEVLKILRNYYYSTPKPSIENIDIAIHIRRGDVDFKTHPRRYTSNIHYNKIIKYFNSKYPNYNIVIFSEGSLEDFNKIKGKNISFRLNENIEKTFHSLVSSKIFVMAKSSFSYSAALLNTNDIYYINFWHKPLKHWKIINIQKNNLYIKN